MVRNVVFIAAVLCTVAICPGEISAQHQKWTVEAVIKQESMTDVSISTDGNRVLWVKRSPDLEKDRTETDVFVSFLDHGRDAAQAETLRLTRTGDNSAPSFSRDGNRVAFLSARAGAKDEKNGQQVWLMDARGGEAQAITEAEGGVSRYVWLDDQYIVFSAREGKTAYERALKDSKDDARVVEDTTLFWPVRLFKLDIRSKEVERLSSNDLQIAEFAPSPDGRYVVYAEDRSPSADADARTLPKQYLIDIESGETREIFTGDRFAPGTFQWALDGSGIYATELFSSDLEHRGAGITELYFYDLASGDHRKVPLEWDRGVGMGSYVVTKNGLHVQLADGPRLKPRSYTRAVGGWTHRDADEYRLRHAPSLSISADGETIVFGYSRPDTVPSYHYAKLRDGRVSGIKTLVELNEHLMQMPLARAEVIEWEGYGGDTVNGILYYPHDYQPGRSYPLIVSIRGGPAAVDLDAWRENWSHYPNTLAERGAFVLRPNYHGSAHHGLEFVESIKGRYYELELPDIVNGIEHLISQGLVDRDSLGVMGWSNGAILTTALTVEYPDMFKAAAPGAGDVNWISDYGNCAFGVRFNNSYFGGAPWERPDHYVEKSPLFRMDRVRTPTLITFGDADTAVPTEQGWQHFRALQQIGSAPVRFILFPDQPHSLNRLTHQKRKMEEELAWFDQYLFGRRTFQEALAERIIRKESPLALLSRRREIATSGNLYGVRNSNLLIPEVVKLNDTLLVGRFEVTRAQFRAFSPNYPIEQGRENYPASGVSFEDAQAYVAWLSEQTGRTYRLPTVDESKSLRKLAGSSENNLSWWLGYDPTLDERRVAEARIRAQNPDDLLQPVGSRAPGNLKSETGPLVYDVDGNVAEWSVDNDGAPRVVTASAATVVDGRSAVDTSPPAAFMGLRVVIQSAPTQTPP